MISKPLAATLLLSVATMTAHAAPKTAVATSSVKDGVDAWRRGDYPAALNTWRPLAIAGDADAQFNLAQAYKLGRGVPVDLQQAEDWYRKAALQGHIQAEDNYGLVLFQNGNRQKALPYIEKSAERGEPRAQYLLGTALFNGDMMQKDWVRAYALMTRASASGLAPASASLAQMDRYIPLDQRQKALAMARQLEMTAMRAPSGPIAQPAPPRAMPPAPVVKPIDLPPSGASYPVYEPTTRPESAPAYEPEPIEVERPAPVTPVQRAVVAPRPAPRVAEPAPAPRRASAATGGGWRVQLGAFGEEGRARALFNSLERRVEGLSNLQPFLVKAGSITRLQVGPLASSAAADKLCAAVRAKGNSCLAIAP